MHIITFSLPLHPANQRPPPREASRSASHSNRRKWATSVSRTTRHPRHGFSRSRPAKHGQTQSKNINKSTSSQLLNKIKQKKNKTLKLITKTSSNSLSPIPTKVDFLYLLTNLQSLFLSSIYYTYIHTYIYLLYLFTFSLFIL